MLQNVIKKLNNVAPKTWMRTALCIVAVVLISVGSFLLDEFVIVDGNTIYRITAHAETAQDAVTSAGIKLSNGDVVTTKDENGKTVISIDRTQSQLNAAKNNANGSVIKDSELLDSATNSSDIVIGDSTSNVQNSGVIFEYETKTEIIKHGTKTVKSRELDKGTTKITKGSDGEKQVVYKNVIVNGVVVATEVYSEKVITKAVDEVKTIGTRVKLSSDKAVMTSDDVKSVSQIKPSKPIELDKNGVPVSYADCISGKASAYWGDKWTATGVASKPGYIAVNPNQIPYGTKMYIVSQDGKYVYGYCIAADTGGFAYNGSGRIVDLRFPDSKQGYAFGVRMVNIYILE